MKKFITGALLMTVLTGCGLTKNAGLTPMQIAANSCRDVGFTPGTSLFLQCMNQQQEAQRSPWQRGFDNMMANPRPEPQYQRSLLPRTTHCSTVGSYVSCTTH